MGTVSITLEGARDLRGFLHGLPGVDRVGAEARAAMLAGRSIKTTVKRPLLGQAVGA
jgi:deoxyribose-phosphate aldolase